MDPQHALLHGIVDHRTEAKHEAQVLVHQRKQLAEQGLQGAAIAGDGALRERAKLGGVGGLRGAREVAATLPGVLTSFPGPGHYGGQNHMMTTRHKAMLSTLSALALALALATATGTAHAQPADEALRGRVEEELLSDGISLTRLGQRLELRTSGTALEVVVSDAASGKVLTTRAIDKLPADRTAAVAQLTVVVSDMLREHGLVPAAGTGSNWSTTFAPAAVVAYHRPASVAVVAVARSGRPGEDTRAAAAGLVAAYRAAGIATVKDGSALGEVGEAEDAAIVARAGALSVEKIAIVRAFAEGASVRAIVTIYGANGQLVTGFSAIAGQALAAPAAAPSNDGSVADQIMRSKPSEPAFDKDGVVRVWVRPKDPQLQLLRTSVAEVRTGGTAAMVGFSSIVCRAECGVVIDGSLGEQFVFGKQEAATTPTFQLLGHRGDVTATVESANRGLLLGGRGLQLIALLGLIGGVTGLFVDDYRTTGAIGIGAAAVVMTGGIVMERAGLPTVTLTQGRPQ
jgi:hypothetical protein